MTSLPGSGGGSGALTGEPAGQVLHAAPHTPRLTPRVRAVLAATVSRVAVSVVVILGAYLAWSHHGRIGGLAHAVLIAPWTHKDAGWFVHIARDGYTAGSGRTAFFPLYPLLVRAVGVLTLGDYWVAGVAISLACYAGAMVLLFRLTAEEAGDKAAWRTVALISVFPTAFVFGAVYSESLFLLLTVAAFLFARKGRWAAAGLAGLLATLTRSSGLVLIVPLLLMFLQQRRRGGQGSLVQDARAAWLLLVPAGLGIYMAYLAAAFGNAMLFSDVQQTYWKRTLSWPWTDVWRGVRAAGRGVRGIYRHRSLFPSGLLPGHRLQFLFARTLLPVGALVFAAVCVVLVFRRLPLHYGVYCVLALLVPLLEPSAITPLYSFHRFVLVVFPLFMGLAIALDRRPKLFWALTAASFLLMLWLALCFTSSVISAHGVV